MKFIHARIAKVGVSTGLKLKSLTTQAKTTFSQLSNSDIAEAMIATWCVEFLRVRRFGGFHVVEIMVISVLMVGLKYMVTEASRRRRRGDKAYTMQTGATQMESMDFGGYRSGTYHGARRFGRGVRHKYRD
jgi:hypothetical protein